jgi:hypothetical protein
MGEDGETECRGFRRGDRREVAAAIRRAVDAAVVLAPDDVGVCTALCQLVDVLGDRIALLVGRHVFIVEALAQLLPRRAGIHGADNAAAGNPDDDAVGIRGIDQHVGDPRHLAAGNAEPALALWHRPERVVELPAFATVVGSKQAARHGAGPNAAFDAARRQVPDAPHGPRMRIVLGIVGLRRKRGHLDLLPIAISDAAPEVRAEMAEVERGEHGIALGQHGGDGVTQILRADDIPAGALARQFKQPLAGADVNPIRHGFLLIRRTMPERCKSRSLRPRHRSDAGGP